MATTDAFNQDGDRGDRFTDREIALQTVSESLRERTQVVKSNEESVSPSRLASALSEEADPTVPNRVVDGLSDVRPREVVALLNELEEMVELVEGRALPLVERHHEKE